MNPSSPVGATATAARREALLTHERDGASRARPHSPGDGPDGPGSWRASHLARGHERPKEPTFSLPDEAGRDDEPSRDEGPGGEAWLGALPAPHERALAGSFGVGPGDESPGDESGSESADQGRSGRWGEGASSPRGHHGALRSPGGGSVAGLPTEALLEAAGAEASEPADATALEAAKQRLFGAAMAEADNAALPQAGAQIAMAAALEGEADAALSARLGARAGDGEGEGEAADLEAMKGALGELLELGDEATLQLRPTERILAPSTAQTLSPLSQGAKGLASEVADAVSRLVADAQDDAQGLLRFRTESGQTFFAQTRVDPHGQQALELRLASEDPGLRALLLERLSELRSALSRIGFADAQVSVERDAMGRDPSRHQPADPESQGGDASSSSSPEAELLAVPTRRGPTFIADPGTATRGRLHIIA